MAVLYRHIRLDSNQPFYIGIGKTEKRAYDKQSRSKHWHAVVNKHGYKVHIMMDDLTWDEAQQKEREFIQLYGRADLGLGTLVNKTDGGDGVIGVVFSEESRAKIGAANAIREIKPETRAKLSVVNTGKPKPKVSAALTGKPKSEEHKANIGAAQTGRALSEEWKAKIGASKKAWWAKKRIENAR